MTEPAISPVPESPDVQEQLRQAEARLAEARDALAASERGRQIDRELAGHGVIDPGAAAGFLEPILAAGTDIAAAIGELKRLKPYLFPKPQRPSSAMSPAPAGPAAPLDAAAAEARASGSSRDLLRYLRLKRGH